MQNLVCDTCGTDNGPKRKSCSTCGQWLYSEKVVEEPRGILTLLPTALVVTALLFVVPGRVFYWIGQRAFDFEELSPALFWSLYFAAWAASLALSARYAPEAGDDEGQRSTQARSRDRRRHERDHGQTLLGFALTPIHLVRMLWSDVFAALKR